MLEQISKYKMKCLFQHLHFQSCLFLALCMILSDCGYHFCKYIHFTQASYKSKFFIHDAKLYQIGQTLHFYSYVHHTMERNVYFLGFTCLFSILHRHLTNQNSSLMMQTYIKLVKLYLSILMLNIQQRGMYIFQALQT